MKVSLLGEQISFPVGVAPSAAHGFLHWEGERATARGEVNGITSHYNTFIALNDWHADE